MRHTTVTSILQVLGISWEGFEAVCQYTLSESDIESLRPFTREKADEWLKANKSLKYGDFQSITDFRMEIEDGDESHEIDWKYEESWDEFNQFIF